MGMRFGVTVLTVGLLACSDPTGVDTCLDSTGIPLASGGCLDTSLLGGLNEDTRGAIEDQIVSTVDLVGSRLALPPVHIVVNTDLRLVIQEVGVGGFAPNANRVTLSIDPSRPDLAGVIQDALPPILAHELHHTARHAAAGYGSTLFEAVVSEGLADHFSLELLDTPAPPWAVALSSADLATWTDVVLAEPDGPYDHARWFLGVDGTVPRWTGFSVGFALVGAFLEANPERRPSELANEPASSFRGN